MSIIVGGSHPHHLHAPKRVGDAGYDLAISEFSAIPPLITKWLRTGVRIAMPKGVWAEIKGRSSTITKYGLLVINSVIDQGFTGELTVGVHNVGACRMCVCEGWRIAQLIFHEACLPDLEYTALPETERGDQGFGSTGT